MTAKTHRLGLTTSEAARHLGVSLSTIRRWSDLGYLRGYRTPGGQRRFSVEQLDEFIESLESGAPPRQAEEPADGPEADAGASPARFHAVRSEPPAPDVAPAPEASAPHDAAPSPDAPAPDEAA